MGRTVSVKLLADVANFTRNIGGQAVGSVKALSGELDKAARAGKLDHVTNQAAALGLGLTGVAAAAVKMAMDFDKQMSAVSAATHAGAAEMGKLREAALQAGKATQFSATQAAEGITELSKAGVSTANILNGGLKGALDLAAAGQLGVGEAAETAASAMTQFKLSGSQVPHIADLLAAAAGKAQGSVHDMGFALNQSGLVAAQFGLSIEDTTGALAEFASAGLLGSDAGTSFKTMLLAMANPSKQSRDLMDELGISFYDAQGQFIGVAGVAKMLQDKLKDLTQEQRNQALGQIFGNDAIRAASILYTDGATGVQKWAKAVNDSGYAQETAAKLTDNLAGDLERLKGSLETLAIQSGGGATEGLRKLTHGAEGAVNAFSDLPGWVQQTITVLTGVGGVSLLAAAGFLKARSTAGDFLTELRDMGPAGTRAADGIGRIGSIAGKLGVAGAAAVGLYQGFKLFGDWLNHFTAPTVRDVDKMSTALQEFANTGRVTGELAKAFGSNLQGLSRDLATAAQAQEKVARLSTFQQGVYAGRGGGAAPNAADLSKVRAEAAQAQANIGALDKALAQTATNGGASQARITFQRLADSIGLNVNQLPLYKQAAAGAALANTGLAKGFGDATANANTMTNSLQSAIDAGQKLTDVWNSLNGAVLGTDKANLAAKQAIDAVKDSFKANKNAIEGNSTAALKNRIAVGEAAKAAASAAQAKYEETGSVKEANKTYNGYITQLRKTLSQSGLTKGKVDDLIGAYARMPDSVSTKVSITGDKSVTNKLVALKAYQDALKSGGGVVSIRKQLSKDNADFLKYARGGWTGPGATYDEAGVVHADEFVIKKSSRRKIEQKHPGLLDAMNDSGEVGYAGGGRVAWPYPVTAAKTRIPSRSEVASAVTPAGPSGGGPTLDFIIKAVHSRFPGMRLISGYRPGARTLSGNQSYHALHRAADWPASLELAKWWNANYKASTKEFISPWNAYNIHNGQRHSYTGAIYRQHSGANAHDHIAMQNGGVIREPVFGYGESGRSYSFGEAGRPETVIPGDHRGGYGAGGSGSATVTISAPITIPGSNLSPQAIAQAVNRELGSLANIYARGSN